MLAEDIVLLLFRSGRPSKQGIGKVLVEVKRNSAEKW